MVYAARVHDLRPIGAACVLAASMGAWACNREPEPVADLPALPVREANDVWAPGEASDAPPVATVLAALRRTHRDVRAQLGPHRLRYRAHFVTTPQPPPPANPPVDAPVPKNHDLHDELELLWASADPRFELRQANDAGRGRHVIRIEDTLYSQLDHRPWLAAPSEGAIDELWLEDAQRSAHDAVAFVAPALAVAAAPEQTDSALVLALSLSTADPSPGVAGSPDSKFRSAARFDAIEGELRIDRKTGIWSALRLHAKYHLDADADAGPAAIHGVLEYDGSLEAIASEVAVAAVTAPPDAAPLVDRTRLREDERRLLHGLVTP